MPTHRAPIRDRSVPGTHGAPSPGLTPLSSTSSRLSAPRSQPSRGFPRSASARRRRRPVRPATGTPEPAHPGTGRSRGWWPRGPRRHCAGTGHLSRPSHYGAPANVVRPTRTTGSPRATMLSIGIPGGRAVRVPWAAMTPAGGFAWNWRRYWGHGIQPDASPPATAERPRLCRGDRGGGRTPGGMGHARMTCPTAMQPTAARG